MIDGQKVLGIIPARGGSKGIPRKNLHEIGGTSLTGFSIAVAKGVAELDQIVLSTDDDEIADVGRAWGIDTPSLRPAHLATDTTPMIDVLTDVLEKSGDQFGYICLLQPTTPFRNPQTISSAIQELHAHPLASACISVAEVTDFHPKRIRRIVNGYIEGYLGENADREREQRQSHASDPAYRRCGTFYVSRASTIREQGSVWGNRVLPYILKGCETITIDEPLDLLLAAAVWDRRNDFPELHYLAKTLGA